MSILTTEFLWRKLAIAAAHDAFTTAPESVNLAPIFTPRTCFVGSFKIYSYLVNKSEVGVARNWELITLFENR